MSNADIDRTSERLLKAIAIYKSIEENEDLRKKWLDAVLRDWRKSEVLEIAKSGGANIGQPFRDKKGGHPYKKYRKFSVPVGWCLGVWSGATLYALMKETNAGGIRIIKENTGENLIYGYEASTKYINFNVGASKKFIGEQREILTKKVQTYIEQNLRVLMQ